MNSVNTPECWGKSELLKKLLQAGKMGSLVADRRRRSNGYSAGFQGYSDELREYNFWATVSISESGCWEWSGRISEHGYGTCHWITGTQQAHRQSWRLTHDEPIGDLCVCHKCDNRKCIRPDHLFLGDYLANVTDMWTKGRGKILAGEQNPRATIDEDKVREIRALRVKGHSYRDISMMVKTTYPIVAAVCYGRTWRNVK